MDAILGTDIWEGNTTVHYDQAYAAGIRFAYVRTFSGAEIDLKYEMHRDLFQRAGVKVGPYYVWDKTNLVTNPASRQAEKMMELAQGFDLVPALDFEKYYGDADLPNREFCINWLSNFYSRLDQIYKGPSLFYTNGAGIQRLRPVPDFILKRMLWLAYPDTWTAALINPWTSVPVHQYALDVSASWAEYGKIDKDGCNVPLEDITRQDQVIPEPEPDPIEARLSALEAQVTSLANSIGTVHTEVTGYSGRISQIEAELAGMTNVQADHEKRIKNVEDFLTQLRPGYFVNLPFVVK